VIDESKVIQVDEDTRLYLGPDRLTIHKFKPEKKQWYKQAFIKHHLDGDKYTIYVYDERYHMPHPVICPSIESVMLVLPQHVKLSDFPAEAENHLHYLMGRSLMKKLSE
jgi:hypothetical protein